MNYDLHIVHEPLQVPFNWFHHFDFMKDDYNNHRQLYTSMVGRATTMFVASARHKCTCSCTTRLSQVYFMDEVIGNMTQILKDRGLWEEVCGGLLYKHALFGAGTTGYLSAALIVIMWPPLHPSRVDALGVSERQRRSQLSG